MRQEDVAKAAMVRDFRGTKLVVLPRRGDPIFTSESVIESEALCDLIAKLYEAREEKAPKPAMSIFFLTLFASENEGPRCAGIFTDAEEAASCLTEESAEDGTFKLAVIEQVIQSGYWPKLEAVKWLKWNDTDWEEVPRPEEFGKVRNFAIG